MKFINFEEGATSFDVAILIKESSFKKDKLEGYYVNPLTLKGFDAGKIMASALPYAGNKVTNKYMKEAIATLVPYIKTLGVKILLIADSNYYKEMTKQKKADTNLDKLVPCTVEGLEDVLVAYTLNYSSLTYNPNQQSKIDISMETMGSSITGVTNEISIPFTSERYPDTLEAIATELEDLHQFDELAVDIEAFSLKLGQAGIASIAFSESASAGVAFLVDYKPIAQQGAFYGMRKDNQPVRALLKKFFEDYQGNLTFHGCAYDIKQLVWELWMDHPLDHKGMLEGIEVMTRNLDDTLFIAFLCLNSTTRPELGLKPLTYSYAGDYAQEDIKDVRKIEPYQLLKYNLSDTCCTYWVKDEYWDRMVAEKQFDIYQDFLKMQKVLFQTELHGMPMNEARLIEVDAIVIKRRDELKEKILNADQVLDAEEILMQKEADKANLKLKKLRKTKEDFDSLEFNPGSDQQLAVLLHGVMGLPVVKLTPAKQPKTDKDTLEILIHKCEHIEDKELLKNIIDYSEVCTFINTFIKAFKEGMMKADGRRYLHGNFNLARVKSGRLSSSDPNLQNLPSSSTYSKYAKSIFEPPEGKLMVFADFNSLTLTSDFIQ